MNKTLVLRSLCKRYPSKQRGYTLLELMISTTLGLIIMAGVVQMYASSRTAQTSVTGTARVQENARYIFNRLEGDIARAGLLGCIPLKELEGGVLVTNENISNLLGLQTAAGSPYDFFQPVAGIDGGAGAGPAASDQLSLRFIAADGLPIQNLDTDVQRVDDTNKTILVDANSPLYSRLGQWQIAVLTDCAKAIIFMITNDPSVDLGEIRFQTGITAPSVNVGQFNACEFNDYIHPGACAAGGITNPYFAVDNNDYDFTNNTNPVRPAVLLSSQGGGSKVYSIQTGAAGQAVGQNCDNANPQYCALFVNNIELADGVEDFQIEFGEQFAANRLAFVPADQITNPDNIRSIRVTLTLNSVDRAGMDAGNNGLYKQTFTRTFNMYNMYWAK